MPGNNTLITFNTGLSVSFLSPLPSFLPLSFKRCLGLTTLISEPFKGLEPPSANRCFKALLPDGWCCCDPWYHSIPACIPPQAALLGSLPPSLQTLSHIVLCTPLLFILLSPLLFHSPVWHYTRQISHMQRHKITLAFFHLQILWVRNSGSTRGGRSHPHHVEAGLTHGYI